MTEFTSMDGTLGEFLRPRDELRIIVLYEPDLASTFALAEKYVPNIPEIDCILCFGPFISDGKQHGVLSSSASSSTSSNNSKESHASTLADVSSILAALENIVCRVVYLASEEEPAPALLELMHLTPNSVNIYARRVSLTEKLFVSGYTEITDQMDIDDSLHGLDQSGTRTHGPAELDIDDIIISGHERHVAAAELSQTIATPISGIFMLNYAHAHTLNQVLFHKSALLAQCGISICAVPSKCGINSFPPRIGNLSMVCVPSLRKEKKYVVIDLKCIDGLWQIISNTIKDI